MTALIGGSLLLIVVAAVSLAMGWVGANESLIWTSIAASVAAAVMLSLGYYRSKAEAARRPAPRPEPTPERPRQEPQPRPAPHATQPVPVVGGEDDADRVVAYADRSRFHRPDCRYASMPGGERIARSTAERRGYDPCGVCKP
jgi:hypothetical protein